MAPSLQPLVDRGTLTPTASRGTWRRLPPPRPPASTGRALPAEGPTATGMRRAAGGGTSGRRLWRLVVLAVRGKLPLLLRVSCPQLVHRLQTAECVGVFGHVGLMFLGVLKKMDGLVFVTLLDFICCFILLLQTFSYHQHSKSLSRSQSQECVAGEPFGSRIVDWSRFASILVCFTAAVVFANCHTHPSASYGVSLEHSTISEHSTHMSTDVCIIFPRQQAATCRTHTMRSLNHSNVHDASS